MFKLGVGPLVCRICLTAPSVAILLNCDSERPTFSDPEQPDASADDVSQVSPDGGATGAGDAQVSPDHSDAFTATHDAMTDETTVDGDAGATQVEPDSSSGPDISTTELADANGSTDESDLDSGTPSELGTGSTTTSTSSDPADVGGTSTNVDSNTGSDPGSDSSTTVGDATDAATSTAATDSGSESTTVEESSECESGPEAPANGDYPNCEGTPSGETCALICDADYAATSDAECVNGAWTEPTCQRLGSLSVRVKEPVTATLIRDAQVYIWGYFDPDADECGASAFCAITDEDGLALLAAIPSGTQRLMLESDGYERLLLPVYTEPNEDGEVTLPLLPEGYSTDTYSIILTWPNDGIDDLDLIVEAPATPAICLNYNTDGSLTETPFAIHEGDVRANGPESVRLALNPSESETYYSGSYRVVVTAPNGDLLTDLQPELRVIAPESLVSDPLNRVELKRLPSSMVAGATSWRAFNLNSDGSISDVNDTEATGDPDESSLPCLAEVY